MANNIVERKCDRCGARINSDVNFCDKCGNKIEAKKSVPVEDNIKKDESKNCEKDSSNKMFSRFRYLTLEEYLNSKEYSSLGFKHKLLFKKMLKKDFDSRGILEEIFFNKESLLSKMYYEKDSEDNENAQFLFAILKISKSKEVLSFLVSNPEEMKWFNNLGKGMKMFTDYLESVDWNYTLAKQKFVTMKSDLKSIMIGTWIIFLILYWFAPTSESMDSFRKLKGQWALNAVAFTMMFAATEYMALKIYIKSKSKIKVAIVMGIFILGSCFVSSLSFVIQKIIDKKSKSPAIEKVIDNETKKNLQDNTDNITQDISKTEKEDLNKIDNNIEKYPNGNIKKIETSQSENGVLTVTTVTYFEDGNINSEQNYTYFKLEGLEDYESIHTTSNYKEYYPNKKLKTSYEEKMEKSGIYEYSSVIYFEDGKVMKKLTGEYLESTGKDLNYKSLVYSPTGVIVSDDTFDDKNSDAAILREYYGNGKIKMEKKYIRDSSGEEKVISLVNYDNGEDLKPEIEASVKNNPQQVNPIENVVNDVPKDKTKEVSQIKPKEKKKIPQCKNYYKGSERDQMIIINKERKYVDSNGCIL